MPTYQAPIRDFRFVLHELLGATERLAACGDDAALDADMIDAVLEEAAKLCEGVLQPINRDGDEIGCTLVDGAVTTPPGFKEAFAAFAEGGWIGLSAPVEDGGQGLPFFLNVALTEMMMAANLSFADYVGLPQAAAKTIAAHGSPAIRGLYLPRLLSGQWGATMCMTEPQCGTDIGLAKTSATPADDGSFAITGTKIFISAGDHDLCDNIAHLVLARLPDAPPGVRGLSLFVCPKILADPDGALGERNALAPVRLEKKMGYRAASTCEMYFDGATGWLIGEPNRGLAAMFTMVNTARLLVALQGLGTSEAAYQAAAAYARDRLQGRSASPARRGSAAADALIVHPDVRRMLLSSRAFNEAGRAIALWFGIQADAAERHADPAEREAAGDLLSLLTPAIKASFSDLGFESCNNAMQIFGGHGYIRDTGVEQFVRDVRIAQIQEGANGVQALDLIGRKLFAHEGRAWRRFHDMVAGLIAGQRGRADMAEFVQPLSAALDALADATAALQARIADDAEEVGAAGVDYQRAFALVMFAWMWTWIASACVSRENEPFYAAKLHVARYFFARELPRLPAMLAVAAAGAPSLMAMPAEQF